MNKAWPRRCRRAGTDVSDRYELRIAPTARRQLTEELPESIAFAAYEFILGPLLDNPHRVGKRLRPPLADRYSARRGTYRLVYRNDDEERRVEVLGVLSVRAIAVVNVGTHPTTMPPKA
jgi:mRNA interferase RelE/StbE